MDASSYWGRIAEPLEYHVGRLGKMVCVVVALVSVIGGVYLLTEAVKFDHHAHLIMQAAPFCGFLFALCGFFIALNFLCYAFRGTIKITSESVVYRRAFFTRSMERDDAVGKRKFYGGRGGPYYVLVSKAGRKMTINEDLICVDHRFENWFDSLPTIYR
jgi:hypothetical protein